MDHKHKGHLENHDLKAWCPPCNTVKQAAEFAGNPSSPYYVNPNPTLSINADSKN